MLKVWWLTSLWHPSIFSPYEVLCCIVIVFWVIVLLRNEVPHTKIGCFFCHVSVNFWIYYYSSIMIHHESAMQAQAMTLPQVVLAQEQIISFSTLLSFNHILVWPVWSVFSVWPVFSAVWLLVKPMVSFFFKKFQIVVLPMPSVCAMALMYFLWLKFY